MNQRHKTKQIIFALFIFLLLATTPLWAWFSFFKLSVINWEGNQKISSPELDKNFRSLYGKNIFKIKSEKIEEILLGDARIRSVDVRRVLPNQLTITIEEKRSILLVYARRLFGLSLDLEPLPLDSLAEDLPVITGLSFSQVKYYRKLQHKELQLAWDLYQVFLKKDLNLANRISEIAVENEKNLLVYFMPDGVKASFGVGNWETKLKRLQEVLQREENLSSVDLRFENMAVLKFKIKKAEELARI